MRSRFSDGANRLEEPDLTSDPRPPTSDSSAVMACRCEEVLNEEIVAAIIAGARSVDDVKRRTRAGMGACQGIYCMPTIVATVSQATGTPIGSVAPLTARTPVRPIPLQALADVQWDDGPNDE
jgi:bacterioferritin-associated ferredoxin